MQIEYRVRPVVRYIITRWHLDPDNRMSGGSAEMGEFAAPWHANKACNALAASEEGAQSFPIDHPSVPDVDIKISKEEMAEGFVPKILE